MDAALVERNSAHGARCVLLERNGLMLSTTRNGAAFMMVSAMAVSAMAGTPACLTMVPEGADALVVMPDLGELLNDMNAVNTMLGDQGKPEVMFMTSMVRGMPGLNLEGSAAVVLDLDDEDPSNEPEAIVLLPVSDFGALTQGQSAENGVVPFNMGGGPSMYFRDMGSGYAAMSNNPEKLRGFEAGSNSESEVASMLGTAGMRGVGSNDVFMMLNLDSIRPMMMEGMESLEAQGEMLELMMGPEAAKSFDMMMNVYRTAANDGQMVMSGLNFDQSVGFSMDFGLQFAEGSDSAAMFNNDGRAGSYISKIPQTDFLFAVAFDMSGDGLRSMLSGYGEMIKGMTPGGAMDQFDMAKLMTMYDGGAMVLGSSDAMMMQGIFSNALFYGASQNPGEIVEVMQAMYSSMGSFEQPGLSMTGSMSAEPARIAGVDVYEHSMRMELDPSMMGGGGMGAPNPQMMMQMMYGPNMGPSGYLAEVDGGVIMTMSKNEALLTKAVEASRGNGSLSADGGISAASKLLPENRVMEMYVGVDHILNMVGPMAMMFGAIPEFQPVGSLTPIAMGMTADGGAVTMRAVVPTATFQAIQAMIPEGAMGGGQDWDEYEDDDDSMDF